MGIRHANRFEYNPGIFGPPIARKLRRYPVKSADGASTIRKLARGLSGLPAAGSGSGPFCCPCIHCYLGTTPSSWTITATGITMVTPSCCVNFLSLITGTGGVIRTMPTLSWNTTFTLDIYSEATSFFGCDCQWTSSYRDSVSFFYGTSACCAIPLDFSTSSAFRWILTRDKTFWALVLLADQGSAGSGVEIPIFYNKIPVDSKDGDCESQLTFTNQLLACPGIAPCGDNVGLSQTGTVVCTPHP